MPSWDGPAAIVVLCASCGLTSAAIGVSIASAAGGIGEIWIAAAVSLLGVVQLASLIGNWRRAPATPASQVAEDGSAVAAKRRIIEARQAVLEGSKPADSASARTADADGGSWGAGESVRTGIDFLDQGELDLHLEPIVELGGTTTVYYRSSLALTRNDGSRVGPYLLSLSAARGGFASALDLALFRRVCPVIRHLKARSRRPGVFCRMSPQSFAERDVLDELVRFLRGNKDAAAGMVIEISQPDMASLSPAGMEGLAYMAELGATLSLSEAHLEGPDPETLVLLGFRFFEIDVAALTGSHGWEALNEDGEIGRLARRAEQAGLTVIAANLVRSEELERVRLFARLARGSLFSPPRVVRRDIADAPDQVAAA